MGTGRSGNGRDAGPEAGRDARFVPAHVGQPRAVFDVSAARYVEFAGTEIGPATEDAVDRAMLDAFCALLPSPEPLPSPPHGSSRPVADLGCGPGRAGAVVAGRGHAVVGFDISTALLRLGRDAHPAIAFGAGRLDRLPVADGAFAGAVSWYSIIYTPPDDLAAVADELARAVAPGGPVLVAFQAGDGQRIDSPSAQGTGLPMTSMRHAPDVVAAALTDAGFALHARTVRSPYLPHEDSDQAFLLARR